MSFVQKMEDDFINDNVFDEKIKDQETLKWKELPTGIIFKILEVVEVDGKFQILTLKNREGEQMRVWACSGLNREKEAMEGTFVRSKAKRPNRSTSLTVL